MIDARTAAIRHAEQRLAAADPEGAFEALRPYGAHIQGDERIALVWARLLGHVDDGPALMGEIKRFARAWPDHPAVSLALAEAAAAFCAREPFDAPRRADGIAALGVQVLGRAVNALGEAARFGARAGPLHMGLARVCSQAGPAFAEDARRAFRVALDLRPAAGEWWLEWARHLLHRGEWALARATAREAAEHLPADRVGRAWWLVATAATALGEGEAALGAWARAGQPADLGADGLPAVAGLEAVEVRLSTATPGPRAAAADYRAEAVWVRPQSPCHGIIVSPSMFDHAGDFGDVILWDGVPLGFREVDGREVPRFCALAILATGAARAFRFAVSPKVDLDTVSLPPGVILHRFAGAHGKLIVPPQAPLAAVRAALDRVVAVPALFEALDHPAAARERRRYAQFTRLEP